MSGKNKEHPKVKNNLHPRNKHRESYDFKLLSKIYPKLARFVKPNAYNNESIDFFNSEAVKALNTALLMCFYKIENWKIPQNYLCPPVPGRADYIHYVADLISAKNNQAIKCLDIGVGANCIYPIIGVTEYAWSFVGSDIDSIAIDSANKIIESNPQLKDKIELRLQQNSKNIFHGIIQKDEYFDLVICNPPFHNSLAEAQAGSIRKLSNLKHRKITKAVANFGGKSNELWCDGGELKFIGRMIKESKQFSNSCFWFTSLVSKQSNLKSIYKMLKSEAAVDVKTIAMGQGNKISRIVAWTFLSK